MSRQRFTGKKRRPVDIAAAEINLSQSTRTDLIAHKADKANPHDTSFTLLIDTPVSYPGFADYLVQVNPTEDGLEFSNTIELYLKLDPNILAFGVGVDPNWIIAAGNVPLVFEGTTGTNPPTVVGDTIVINSAGLYEISASFGVDIISGNNSATFRIAVNGVLSGIRAGVEFSGGQSAPITQPLAKDIKKLLVGDVITFEATEIGVDDKLLLWQLSGGSVQQLQHDFANFPPP
jgi:hypothetical protein